MTIAMILLMLLGPGQKVLETQVGDATFYSKSFQGDKTASGLKFDNRKAVAAHRRFPFGTVVRVTNLDNGKSVNVTIVDRGPHGKNRREGAIIDLSQAAARQLDMIEDGQVRVRLDVLKWGDSERPTVNGALPGSDVQRTPPGGRR